MKTCFKCQTEKPLSEFYRHPRMKDGHLNKCKSCAKDDVRTNYALRREQYQDYEKVRAQEPHRIEARRAGEKRHRQRHPDRSRARNTLKRAIRSGKLARGRCEVCGNEKAEAHHDDYSKPLDVHWLCFEHHRGEHGQTSLSGHESAISNY